MAITIMVHVEISLSRFHFKEGVARPIKSFSSVIEWWSITKPCPLLEKKDVYLIIGNDWFLN